MNRILSIGRNCRTLLAIFVASTLMLSGAGICTASATQVTLLLPQSTAFAILGHSCGGIQEHSFATGFDPVSGYPVGNVYMQTRCGGSGRGGGYKTTTYSAWAGVTWDFGGNVLSSAKLTTVPAINPNLSVADSYGDQVYNANNLAYLVVPAPTTAPTILTAAESGDQIQVSWAPNGINPKAITSSTLTATPAAPSTASAITVTVSGAATSGAIALVQPQTTYQITVVSTTIGGSSPASPAVSVTTAAASIPPSAPIGLITRWGAAGASTATLLVTWQAALPGDSPIDAYQVQISGSDGGGTLQQTVSGTTLNASFTVNFIPDWTVIARAHNGFGWGPWSTPVTQGGL